MCLFQLAVDPDKARGGCNDGRHQRFPAPLFAQPGRSCG